MCTSSFYSPNAEYSLVYGNGGERGGRIYYVPHTSFFYSEAINDTVVSTCAIFGRVCEALCTVSYHSASTYLQSNQIKPKHIAQYHTAQKRLKPHPHLFAPYLHPTQADTRLDTKSKRRLH